MNAARAMFPSLQARSLAGRTYSLPRDFEGDLNIILVAFERWHQALVESWLPYLDSLAARHLSLRVYEVPVLSSHYKMMRPFIDATLAASIDDPHARARTLTTYTDRQAVLAALRLPNHHDVAILLMDNHGVILWQGHGGYDACEADMLEHALEVDPLTSLNYRWA